MQQPGALEGIRVIDLTTVLMGPLSTRMLGDHGADVIRVEAPGGDSARNGVPGRNPGMSGFSLNLQRNKRSLVIDLKNPDGPEVMWRLIESADVLVTNMRRAALQRLGFDAGSVRQRFPDLIYCEANGFGSTGRYADRAAYDDAIQAASGISGLYEQVQGEPAYVPSVIADKVVGLHIVQAVMAALLHRHRTGEGQTVEVPMFETMVAFNVVEHLRGAIFEPPLGPVGYPRLMSSFRRPFMTADGWMCLLPYTDKNWMDFFTFIKRPEIADDERFSDANSRVRNVDDLYGLLDQFAPEHTTAEWVEFCERVSIPASPVMRLENMSDDPHLQDVGLVDIVDHPTEGKYRNVNDAITYSASPTALHRHTPRIGEHSLELLTELGFEEQRRRALLESGAIHSS